MRRIDPGLKVMIIEDNTIRKGVVKSVCPDIELAVVNFDDGEVEKVYYSELGIIPDEPAEEKQEETIANREITITLTEFISKVVNYSLEYYKDNQGLGLLFSSFLIGFTPFLFSREVDND